MQFFVCWFTIIIFIFLLWSIFTVYALIMSNFTVVSSSVSVLFFMFCKCIFITDQFTINALFLQFCCITTVTYICFSDVIFLHNVFNFFFILVKHFIVIISLFIIHLFHKVCTLWMGFQTLFWIQFFDFVKLLIILFKLFISLCSSVSEFFFEICYVSLHFFNNSTLL